MTKLSRDEVIRELVDYMLANPDEQNVEEKLLEGCIGLENLDDEELNTKYSAIFNFDGELEIYID